MTLEKKDKPFIITDGALNVLPKLETKMHILKNSINFAKELELLGLKFQFCLLQKKFWIAYLAR